MNDEIEKRILELLASPGGWNSPVLISRDDLRALFVSYGNASDELKENEGVINVWRRRCVEAEERVASLEAARLAYASEFPPNSNGESDVGSIHENIRKLKRDSIEYIKRTDAQIEHISKQLVDAERDAEEATNRYTSVAEELDKTRAALAKSEAAHAICERELVSLARDRTTRE